MPTPHTTTNAGPAEQGRSYLPAGFGAWDVTSFPFGGDFIRPKSDLELSNVRESHQAGHMLGECAYPPRRGVRTICFRAEHLKSA